MNFFNIEIIPREGIILDGKKILLGATKEEVILLLGAPQIVRDSFYYYSNELRFDFDEAGKTEFIEFLGGIDGNLKPQIYGISVFDNIFDIVYSTLLENNGREFTDIEDGHCHVFDKIGIRIYRGFTHKEFEESLRAMKAEGIPFENYADYESDKRKAFHWDTIGVGRV
jgi:hypothetical protein